MSRSHEVYATHLPGATDSTFSEHSRLQFLELQSHSESGKQGVGCLISEERGLEGLWVGGVGVGGTAGKAGT